MKKKSLTNNMKGWEKAVIYTALIIFFSFCFLPFILMISGSFTQNDALKEYGIHVIPKVVDTSAYMMLFEMPDQIVPSYLITIFVTALGVVLNIFLTLLIAFPLADTEYKYRKIFSFLLYFTVLFSPGIVPIYILIRRVYMLYDTLWILIIYNLVIPGYVFSMRVYIQEVPQSIYESARIDGASEFRILFQMVTPLVKPGIAIIAFNIAIMYWNDSMTPLMFTDNYTPIALYLYRWENYINYLKLVQSGAIAGVTLPIEMDIPENTIKYAMGVVSSLPLIIIFLFFQKQFIGGLTSGAVKG